MAVDEEEAAVREGEAGQQKWVGWSSAGVSDRQADAQGGDDDDAMVDFRNPEWTGMKSSPRPPSVPPQALCWVRVDADCHMLALTGNGGPRWSAVIYKSTYNQDTGELVHEEAIVPGMPQEHLHRLIDKTERIKTHLWCIPDPIEVGNVVALKKMVQPSKSQIREHELQNHAVFCDWCKVCIEARATGSKHKKKTPEQRAEQGASIHSDFFFMEQATFLALKSQWKTTCSGFAVQGEHRVHPEGLPEVR